ncbi:hypothetical protein JCM19301_241 [Jejuia pallidilutea]|uniref:Uncharacterized protein n=1 Tax=Jejuia pallidilutea TaxID=504487 RepID=A0A090VUA1_9FLAO|nr:hypothetical protein JCM19301_241 [Jejuia pallidilutea]
MPVLAGFREMVTGTSLLLNSPSKFAVPVAEPNGGAKRSDSVTAYPLPGIIVSPDRHIANH